MIERYSPGRCLEYKSNTLNDSGQFFICLRPRTASIVSIYIWTFPAKYCATMDEKCERVSHTGCITVNEDEQVVHLWIFGSSASWIYTIISHVRDWNGEINLFAASDLRQCQFLSLFVRSFIHRLLLPTNHCALNFEVAKLVEIRRTNPMRIVYKYATQPERQSRKTEQVSYSEATGSIF